jgi:hypothetical protein
MKGLQEMKVAVPGEVKIFCSDKHLLGAKAVMTLVANPWPTEKPTDMK